MSKEAYLKSLIEDCSKRVPPKQSSYLEYFQRLRALAGGADADFTDIAARLWLALFKPQTVTSLSATSWRFRLDEHVLGILERLITRGLIGVGSTIDITQTNEEGEVKLVETFDIMTDTFRVITLDFDVKSSSPTAQIKLIQLLLTAGTDPNGAIKGANLGIALNKLAQIMLNSVQAVNQNAAKAAITQIINGRLEHNTVEDALDQEVIFAWLCGVINHGGCPSSLAVFCLSIIYSILTEHSVLFLGGALARCIPIHLLPMMIGPLNRQNEAVFSLCIDILAFIMESCMGENKEVIEIIISEYFGTLLPSAKGDGSFTLFKDPLKPYENKMKAVEFFKNKIFGNPEILLNCFLNFDMDAGCADVISRSVELLQQFADYDGHRREGERIPGTLFTDKELNLCLNVVAALHSFMTKVMAWHRQSPKATDRNDAIIAEYLSSQKRKQELRACVAAFVDRPADGIVMAIKSDFIKQDDVKGLARWLRFTRGIEKKSLGDYLGVAENSDILKAYIGTFDFKGLSFVTAFRQFLESFRIPGESQVIERFLEEFSHTYIEANPGLFADADVLFQVSYSTLMLNTDMYSSSVREKMTEASFLKNTMNAIDEDKRPTAEILQSIYHEIATAEIQLQSQVVENPLTLGSRKLLPFRQADAQDILSPLILAISNPWSKALSTTLEKFSTWPENSFFTAENSLFACQADLFDKILSLFTDFMEICSARGFDNERYCALESLLATAIFRPDYGGGKMHPANSGVFNGIDGTSWLYDVCDERGNELGSAWKLILQRLAQWDLASLVDSNHNLRELDFSRLDGNGLLFFFNALLSVDKDTMKQRAFVSHYAERLFQLPSSSLERVIRSSYEKAPASDSTSFFSLLACGADDAALAEYMFGLLQRVAREQMPIILALKNEAMFGFLRALERFALQPELGMGQDAVETFATIGDLLYAQHHTDAELKPVGDEEFFLKWYHILSGLSRVAAEQPVREIARMAIQTLFKLLKSHGACYGEGAWRVVWRSIILPLLEEVRDPEADTTMFVKLISWSVDLICLHHERLFSPTLPDIFENVLKHLETMAISIETDRYTEEGLDLLQTLILNNHIQHFTTHHWDLVTELFLRIYKALIPEQNFEDFLEEGEQGSMLPPQPSTSTASLDQMDKSDLSMSSVFSNEAAKASGGKRERAGPAKVALLARQCSMQLLLLRRFREMIINSDTSTSIVGPDSTMTFSALKRFLHICLRAYEFALSFNSNVPLRKVMLKHQLADSLDTVVLNQQESGSLLLLCDILYSFYLKGLKSEKGSLLGSIQRDKTTLLELSKRYFEISQVAIQRYIELRQPNILHRKIGRSWVEMTTRILRQWNSLGELYGNGEDLDVDLLLLGEGHVEVQMAVVVELVSVGDRAAPVASAAKECLLASLCRLTHHRLDSLGFKASP